jgi:hypothetical protein
MTKGERISRKLKTKNTNNKRDIKKSTRKNKTTHNRGQIISIILGNCGGEGGQWSPPSEPSSGAPVPLL